MVIPMKHEHIDMIKSGQKTTTLRSLKELYPLSDIHLVRDYTGHLQIRFKSRELVYVSENDIGQLDIINAHYSADQIANREGYKSWNEIVSGLKALRHKLPKRMWLYTFEVVGHRGIYK